MATTTQCTIAICKSTLLKIKENMGSTFWKEYEKNPVNAKLCLNRLLEIQGKGLTGSIDGGHPGSGSSYVDLFNLL